ncbi:MAG: thioredoxin [Defluviitaleaceae bacterium]|nr:thioredoxin [Defluviitaleaceae bacterium]
MSIQKLDKNNFNPTIENADKPIIVDFYAEWCGPCKMMAPVMEEIARSNDNIAVYRVDVDENPDLAVQFSIMSIPTIISFKDAKPYKTAVGAQGMPNILKLVQ